MADLIVTQLFHVIFLYSDQLGICLFIIFLNLDLYKAYISLTINVNKEKKAFLFFLKIMKKEITYVK